MVRIKKIALTGGPCAGKTAALQYLTDKLATFGVEVITVKEQASSLMADGKTPEGMGSYAFHSLLFSNQLKEEAKAEETAQESKASTVLIVCDRGLLDSRAYVSSQEFESYSAMHSMNEDIIRNRYDAVFHLVTAADGAEEHYECPEGTYRSESIEQARELDERLLALWTGTAHLRVIDNSTGFERKLSRLLEEVKAVIGIPKPLEIERKFLIKYPDIELMDSIDTCRRVPVTQAYLDTPEEGRFRIRRRGEGEDAVYIKTVKRKINDLTHIETEDYISEKEYYGYLEQKKYVHGVISKDRYCIALNSMYYELDVYPFFNDRATLEIELLSEDQPYVLPDFVKVIREVTFEKQYKNKYLAIVYGDTYRRT